MEAGEADVRMVKEMYKKRTVVVRVEGNITEDRYGRGKETSMSRNNLEWE